MMTEHFEIFQPQSDSSCRKTFVPYFQSRLFRSEQLSSRRRTFSKMTTVGDTSSRSPLPPRRLSQACMKIHLQYRGNSLTSKSTSSAMIKKLGHVRKINSWVCCSHNDSTISEDDSIQGPISERESRTRGNTSVSAHFGSPVFCRVRQHASGGQLLHSLRAHLCSTSLSIP